MKIRKFLLVAALACVSGAALANYVAPLYNPASVYNASTGQYENGCGTSTFITYSSYSRYSVPAMLDGGSTTLGTSIGYVTIYCSGGTLSTWVDESQGDLTT